MSSQETKSLSKTASKGHRWVTSSFGDFGDFGASSSQPTSQPKKKTTSYSSQKLSGPSWQDTPSSSQQAPSRNINPGNQSRKREREDSRISVSRQDRRKPTSSDNVPWAERHIPQCQADLAVHKKKISEVEQWLKDHIEKRQQSRQHQGPMLLLTGPSGAGKTATIRVLAKEMKIEVQEWANPVTSVYSRGKDEGSTNTNWKDFIPVGGHQSESQFTVFQDFLTRSNKYQALQIFGEDTSLRKMVIVEDLPNIVFRDPQSFHNILRKFRNTGRCPLVFIVSDSHGSESNALKLFPKDVQDSLGVYNISFNPVAPTSMTKVLTRIANTESLQGQHKCYIPNKSTLEALAAASCGDIRSAINSLQFACLKDTKDLASVLHHNTKGKKNASSKPRQRGSKKKEETSDAVLSAIGGRDTSLFLFRALGKILYCKREPKPEDYPVLPSHLSHQDRDKLKIDTEQVLGNTHMSSEMFNLYLHQNYLEFYESLDDVVEASTYFSDADFLTTEWSHRSALREYGASVAARGLMHCNSTRSRHDAMSAGKWRPLHKPQWFEVSRKSRESCAAAKGLFIGHCWTPVDLQTQLLPYLAIINIPLKNPGQIAFLQELTRYSSKQAISRGSWSEKLDEKEVDEDEDEFPSSQRSTTSQSALQKPEIVSESTDAASRDTMEDEEEDIIIEDFDD